MKRVEIRCPLAHSDDGQLASEGRSESVVGFVDRRICSLHLSIDSHIGNIEWDLEHACEELKLDISPPYAARLFKRCTGQAVREYVKWKRLQMAAERLTATEVPVKVIAAESGYRLPRDFTRRFKEQYHMSPTAYRKHIA